MKPIPLFGSGVESYSTDVTSQRRLNCFYDIRIDQDKQKIVIIGTPGSTLWATLPKLPIRGWRYVNTTLYVVAGNTLYKVLDDGSYSNLGTLSTAIGYVYLEDNGVQLLIVDGETGYIYTIIDGTYAQSSLDTAGSFGIITDANFPNGTNSISFLDGKFIAVRPGSRQFYITDSYDGTNWTPNSGSPVWGTKENSSDDLISTSVISGVLLLFGSQTTEFWQDVGSSPLPYSRINGATQDWGIAATASVAPSPDSRFLLGQNKEGGLRVLRLVGNSATVVSNSDIESILSGMSKVSDAVGLTYYSYGHQFYQITFPTENRTLLLDVNSNFWSESQTGLDLVGRHQGELGVAAYGYNLISDSTTGNIYRMDPDNHTDNGEYIKRQLVSRHVHFDQNESSISSICLDMETGVGGLVGLGIDPQIVMQVSKDGGKTFGVEKPVSLGELGHYRKTRAIWRRLGRSNDFVFKFTVTDPVKFVVISATADIASGNQVVKGG